MKVALEVGFKEEAVTLASMFSIASGTSFPLAKTSWELKKKTLLSLKEEFCSEVFLTKASVNMCSSLLSD